MKKREDGTYTRWRPDRRTPDEKIRDNILGTVRDAAIVLNVPESWVYNNAEKLPGYVRYGKHIRFDLAALKATAPRPTESVTH